MDKPVLAQYSIRSKQAYVFKTNHMQEIIGASSIIEDTFNFLFQSAQESPVPLKVQRIKDGNKEIRFELADVLKNFSDRSLDMVELFIGGGNDTVLYRNRECFVRANQHYTRNVLEQYPGLLPFCVGVEVSFDDSPEGDYERDYQKLMAEADRQKNRMLVGRGYLSLPFSQMDRTTFTPISRLMYYRSDKGMVELTEEAAVKRERQMERRNKNLLIEAESRYLDDLVTEKGEESLLAIIHVDGNNMGMKIQQRLDYEHSGRGYDRCIRIMRDFTEEIDKVFQEDGKDALDNELKSASEEARIARAKGEKALPEEAFSIKYLVRAGDDFTFICNARLALRLTRAYLAGVSSSKKGKYSSCAGICIFHSHYPFAQAYALAEQACDNAKKTVHDSAAKNSSQPLEQCWLDFHYLRSGTGGDLKEIRQQHRTDQAMMRPYLVCGYTLDGKKLQEKSIKEESKYIGKLDQLYQYLRDFDVSRSKLKMLGAMCEVDFHEALLTWDDVCSHTPAVAAADGRKKTLTLKNEANKLFSGNEELLRTVYDLSEIYDIWYRGGDS